MFTDRTSSGRGRRPRPTRAGVLTVVTWAIALAACSEDEPTAPAGPPTALAEVAGDDQEWFFSNELPEPYQVVVLDADGRGVPGVQVTWTVTSGGGTVDPAVSTTGPDGVAEATHTLGPTEATQSVTASAAGLPDVDFTATASDPPTSGAVTVDDDVFAPATVAVQVGGTVTWTWVGDSEHNVVFTGAAPRPPDSPTQTSGTYSVTFTDVGVRPYVCNIHAGMSGTVRVVN